MSSIEAVSAGASLGGRLPVLAPPQLEQPEVGKAQAGERPGATQAQDVPGATASPGVAGSECAKIAHPMEVSESDSALTEKLLAAVLAVERKDVGYEEAVGMLSKATFSSLKAAVLANKARTIKDSAGAGQPETSLLDTQFTYLRLQLTAVPKPKATEAPSATSAPPAAAQAAPDYNAQLDMAMRGQMGPAQLKAVRQNLLEGVLRALFTGKEGFPVVFRAAFTQDGGGPLPGFWDDGSMRVRNEEAPLLLGQDLQGSFHVFPDEQGILMAVRLVPTTAPHKQVLTMVEGLPADITNLEVFTFFNALLQGGLKFSDVQRSQSWAAPVASAAAGDNRLELEALAHQCLNWSIPVQPARGSSAAPGDKCAFYLTTRYDDAGKLPPRMVMTRLEGICGKGGKCEVTLACTGEAVRGCSGCGALDHPTASCMGRGIGRSMPRFNEEGVRMQAPSVPPPAPGSSAPGSLPTPGVEAPDNQAGWQKARSGRGSRKAPLPQVRDNGMQRGKQGRSQQSQHQRGHAQQHQRGHAQQQQQRGHAQQLQRGHPQNPSSQRGAGIFAPSYHPSSILKRSAEPSQQTASAMEVDQHLPPTPRTLAGSYLDAARRPSPNKPAFKRPPPCTPPPHSSQPGPRHTEPDPAEAAEHLGLNAAPRSGGTSDANSPTSGILCHDQQPVPRPAASRPRLESPGTDQSGDQVMKDL